MRVKQQISAYPRHWDKQQSGQVPCPQSFPTSWHTAGLEINREACCAPRMHVCRVPISEYTVIGLPEGLYLTFRLQVTGHSTAHPSSVSDINPFLAHFSQNSNKVRKNNKSWRSCDMTERLKAANKCSFCQLLFTRSQMNFKTKPFWHPQFLSKLLIRIMWQDQSFSARLCGQCHSNQSQI